MGIFMHKVQRLCSKRNNNLQLNRDNCPTKCGHPADLEHCEEIIRVRIFVIRVLDIDKKCKMDQQRREKMSKVTDDSLKGRGTLWHSVQKSALRMQGRIQYFL